MHARHAILPTEPHPAPSQSFKNPNIFISLMISYMYTIYFDSIHPSSPSHSCSIIFAGSLSPLDFCRSGESGSSLGITGAPCLALCLFLGKDYLIS